jgi:hypothetical protein
MFLNFNPIAGIIINRRELYYYYITSHHPWPLGRNIGDHICSILLPAAEQYSVFSVRNSLIFNDDEEWVVRTEERQLEEEHQTKPANRYYLSYYAVVLILYTKAHSHLVVIRKASIVNVCSWGGCEKKDLLGVSGMAMNISNNKYEYEYLLQFHSMIRLTDDVPSGSAGSSVCGLPHFFMYYIYSFLILMTLIRKRGSLKADV